MKLPFWKRLEEKHQVKNKTWAWVNVTFGVVSGWDDELTNQTSQQTVPLEQDEPATVRKGSDGSEILYNNLVQYLVKGKG